MASQMPGLHETIFWYENQAQDASKTPPDAPKGAQDGPRSPQEAPQAGPRRQEPVTCPDGSDGADEVGSSAAASAAGSAGVSGAADGANDRRLHTTGATDRAHTTERRGRCLRRERLGQEGGGCWEVSAERRGRAHWNDA